LLNDEHEVKDLLNLLL